MAQPITTYDETYSDPDGSAATWDETRAALEASEIFWATSVRPDGRPHSTPVVAVWSDDALWFSTGVDEVKFANMKANPHILMTTGTNTWDSGLDVIVEGEAEQITDNDVLRRVSVVFRSRWDGRWTFVAGDGCFTGESGEGEAMVFKIAPKKVFAHKKGDPFGATKHEFSS